jgi:hypothetical protein
VHTIE